MLNHKTAMSAVSATLLSSMLLAACGGGAPAVTTPQVIERTVVVERTVQGPQQVVTSAPMVITATPGPNAEKPAGKVLRLNLGAGDVPSLDPSLATDTSSVQLIEEMTVGLTRQNDETGAPELSFAEKMDLSPDGKTYTFHLMKNVPWVKYNPGTKAVEKVKDDDGNVRVVTAKDFEYATLRTLDPKTASDYAFVLNIISGAADFNGSKISDTTKVGVTAVDTYTLQVKLDQPAGYAPGILGLWVMHAEPEWVISDKGDRWTETGLQQSYGPYTLKSWNHESDITLVKNPYWPGSATAPQAKIDEVRFSMLDESPAFANYESGDLDVSAPPQSEIDRVKADPQLSKELKISPSPCTYYYGLNTKKAPFDNPKVRLAVSEAIDRQSIIENVTKAEQEPAQWFARPGSAAVPTTKDYPDLGVKYNADDAKKLLASVYPDASKAPPITLMVNQVEGHVKIAEAVANMLKNTLGLNVQLQQQEWKVFLKTVRGSDPPQMWRLGWCEDYPDADSWDREVFHSDNGKPNVNGNPTWQNAQFDKLTDQAAAETDIKKRMDLYAQAEKILIVDEAAIVPIYWYTHVSLTKPYVQRTYAVSSNQHFEKWDLQAH